MHVGRWVLALVVVAVTASAGVTSSGSASASGGYPDSGEVSVQGLLRPEAMTTVTNGRRYIADTFRNRIVRVDGGGPPVTALSQGLGPYPGGVAVDAAGRLYVSDSFNHRILRLDPGSTNPVVIAGSAAVPPVPGAGASGLNTPSKIALDTGGRLYVADTNNARVMRFDGVATASGPVAGVQVAGTGSGRGIDQMSFPVGLTIAPDGSLYVADRSNNRVMRYSGVATATGPVSATLVAGSLAGTRGAGLDLLSAPTAVAVDGAGDVLVADTNNHRVVRWSPAATSGVLVAGGSLGSTPDKLNLPTDVTIDGPWGFSVLDRENGRVLTFAQQVPILPEPDLMPLMTALAAETSLEIVPVSGTTMTPPGCAPVPLPVGGPAHVDLLSGNGYLSSSGPVGAVPESCRPAAVTVSP